MDRFKHTLSLQGPERWRAAANLYLYINPKSRAYDETTGEYIIEMDARTEAKIIAAECKQARGVLEKEGNKFGLSQENMGKLTNNLGNRRYMLRMPANMLQFIQMIDPTLLEGTPAERKSTWRKMVNEFREYQIAKV